MTNPALTFDSDAFGDDSPLDILNEAIAHGCDQHKIISCAFEALTRDGSDDIDLDGNDREDLAYSLTTAARSLRAAHSFLFAHTVQ
ncbi:hypothetical protein ACQP2U_43370 (plasmid) [Nocardia sp. CA-084685]|uniref:hypothetical protein n=1 Tax=Nocardia sp. CA-084685 TaxID=3239970 RepID=UPI003D99859C